MAQKSAPPGNLCPLACVAKRADSTVTVETPVLEHAPEPPMTQLSASPCTPGTQRLVLSVAEAANALGISDDLVYELTERGELPCLHFGRRKVIPRQAIELVIAQALRNFDPAVLVSTLAGWRQVKGETSMAARGGAG